MHDLQEFELNFSFEAMFCSCHVPVVIFSSVEGYFARSTLVPNFSPAPATPTRRRASLK
jgi:hypothetical protein